MFDSTCLRDYFEITSTCLRSLLCKSLKIRHIKNAMNRLQNSAILIIGNFIFATHKPLKYSIFAEEKFINGRFALHNSKKSSIFAENFGKEDEKQVFDMDDRSDGSLPHGELQCAEG